MTREELDADLTATREAIDDAMAQHQEALRCHDEAEASAQYWAEKMEGLRVHRRGLYRQLILLIDAADSEGPA